MPAANPKTKRTAAKYSVELDELEHVIWKTLDRISKRPGVKINRVAARVERLAALMSAVAEDFTRRAPPRDEAGPPR
jgi:hypothetical protein